MALIRWSPFAELARSTDPFDQLFGPIFEPGFPSVTTEGFLPLDIERKNGSYVVKGSLPGFKPDEVTVSIDNGLLTIDASHKEEKETKEKEFVRKERFEGHFHREVALGEVDAGKATAEFKDGVLTLTVPRTTKVEPVKIPVTK